MSKYDKLWSYMRQRTEREIVLSFDEFDRIAGVPVDHSFLTYKKELLEYGYKVGKISMKQQTVTFEKLPKSTLVLYVHGKGGTADEAAHYQPLFPECDVVGFDYVSETAWDAKEEFSSFAEALFAGYERVILIANSIGAYYSMCALPQEKLEHAYFISPIVSMERLICDMMQWAGVAEAELCEKGIIETDFGEPLSWRYLCYTREYPFVWNVPTDILYGERDNLTALETVTAFTNAHSATLTVMKDGEHWFHTLEQMAFLDRWIARCENANVE